MNDFNFYKYDFEKLHDYRDAAKGLLAAWSRIGQAGKKENSPNENSIAELVAYRDFMDTAEIVTEELLEDIEGYSKLVAALLMQASSLLNGMAAALDISTEQALAIDTNADLMARVAFSHEENEGS